jgi:hypothetical protein
VSEAECEDGRAPHVGTFRDAERVAVRRAVDWRRKRTVGAFHVFADTVRTAAEDDAFGTCSMTRL